ncbi:MAG: SGNH/GDSL hydrolase family protein, partial [Bdellovibrionales bacterium]|nr:SGNH/GDSL hydrolase family protein [Bdellovibrionales bacterium]
MNMFKLLISFLAIGQLLTSSAFACPSIGAFNLSDYNCDQKFKMVFTGDSIAKGVGDVRNSNKGGYVKRVKQFFGENDVSFVNLGVAGITTGRLLREFQHNLTKNKAGKTQDAIFGSDAVMVDCGRNDFWQNRETQSETQRAMKAVRNMKRISSLLVKQTRKNGAEAFVFFSTLIPTSRDFQNGFVNKINQLMLKGNNKRFRVLVRFDKRFKTRLLQEDGLHPSSAGYDRITDSILVPFLEGKFLSALSNVRPDSDGDGIYDAFEEKSYGTSSDI